MLILDKITEINNKSEEIKDNLIKLRPEIKEEIEKIEYIKYYTVGLEAIYTKYNNGSLSLLVTNNKKVYNDDTNTKIIIDTENKHVFVINFKSSKCADILLFTNTGENIKPKDLYVSLCSKYDFNMSFNTFERNIIIDDIKIFYKQKSFLQWYCTEINDAVEIIMQLTDSNTYSLDQAIDNLYIIDDKYIFIYQ